MEAYRRLKFTGVELIGGTELAASVEKAMIGLVEKTTMDLVRAVTALVEKAIRALEKAVADGRCGGDGGRRAATVG